MIYPQNKVNVFHDLNSGSDSERTNSRLIPLGMRFMPWCYAQALTDAST